jgi:hypothetical protein
MTEKAWIATSHCVFLAMTGERLSLRAKGASAAIHLFVFTCKTLYIVFDKDIKTELSKFNWDRRNELQILSVLQKYLNNKISLVGIE